MKFTIKESSFYPGAYYIRVNKYITPLVITRELNLTKEEYEELLKKYNADFIMDDHIEYYFRSQEDAERFINSDELLPYLVMGKLMEEL